jgi:hypothetical protein
MPETVTLSLPFTGRWAVQNSPAHRVPSHGTELYGMQYAIDFVGVDDRRRTARRRDWRTALATEPPERFVAFGRPLLAPADGVVVAAVDGEPDHHARRSPITLASYAMGQASRVRHGLRAVAGNHVVVALADGGGFVALVHLRSGSVAVEVGQAVTTGQPLGACGNSGNSTQPHVHLQVTDSADFAVAQGVPVEFRAFREWPRGGGAQDRAAGVPDEGAVVEPLGVAGG